VIAAFAVNIAVNGENRGVRVPVKRGIEPDKAVHGGVEGSNLSIGITRLHKSPIVFQALHRPIGILPRSPVSAVSFAVNVKRVDMLGKPVDRHKIA
jgi:hypothetical protein